MPDDIDYWEIKELPPKLQEKKEGTSREAIGESDWETRIHQPDVKAAEQEILSGFKAARSARASRTSPSHKTQPVDCRGIVDQLEKSFALKEPGDLFYDEKKPKGCRLSKQSPDGKPWESRSLDSALLAESPIAGYSYFALNMLRVIYSSEEVETEFKTMLEMDDDDLRECELDPKVFCSGKVSMEAAEGGGVYFIFSKDGRVYTGYTISFKVRRKGHKEEAVNCIMLELEKVGQEDRSQWESFAVFNVTENYISSYSFETIFNFIVNSTGKNGMNVNRFDHVRYGAKATEEQLTEIWNSAVEWLEEDETRYLYRPETASAHSCRPWEEIDTAPLAPAHVWHFLRGERRRRAYDRLKRSNPLPHNAFIESVPVAQLDRSERQKVKKRKADSKVVGAARKPPQKRQKDQDDAASRAARQQAEEAKQNRIKNAPSTSMASMFGNLAAQHTQNKNINPITKKKK